jgi:hypothetical protein
MCQSKNRETVANIKEFNIILAKNMPFAGTLQITFLLLVSICYDAIRFKANLHLSLFSTKPECFPDSRKMTDVLPFDTIKICP